MSASLFVISVRASQIRLLGLGIGQLLCVIRREPSPEGRGVVLRVACKCNCGFSRNFFHPHVDISSIKNRKKASEKKLLAHATLSAPEGGV